MLKNIPFWAVHERFGLTSALSIVFTIISFTVEWGRRSFLGEVTSTEAHGDIMAVMSKDTLVSWTNI